jgi:hypothetical protein
MQVRGVMRHPAADYDAQITLASGAALAATAAFGAGAFANLANQVILVCPLTFER